MDTEGSSFTTADLLSLRYPMTQFNPCSSGSLLLSSPWPISSTPSPPSSNSSSSPSSSATTISDGTLLSVSTSSPSSACSPPPSSIPPVSSPVPSELSLGTGTAVIFTTTSTSPLPHSTGAGETGLALADPVSKTNHSYEVAVAHAQGKSILCVHEQDQGNLIHFSTSPSNGSNGLHDSNLVNCPEDDDGTDPSTSTNCISRMMEQASDKDFITVQSSLLGSDNCNDSATSVSNSKCTRNTDGNIFPTLILTSAGNSNDPNGDNVIPMRLYASLTSPATNHSNDPGNCPTSLNGSILTTGDGGDNGGACILMTQLTSDHHQLQHQHHLLISERNENDDNDVTSAGDAFSLGDFTTHHDSTNNDNGDLQTTTLEGSSILLDNCYDKNSMTFTHLSNSSSSPMDGYSSHGKLKDILMNGNSHNHHHNQGQHSALISHSSTNRDTTYLLRDLEGTTGTSGAGEGVTFYVTKDEDDNTLVEELKLHSVEQSNFNEAINSIYSNSTSRNLFCDGNSPNDLIMVTTSGGQQDFGGSPSSELITIPSTSISSHMSLSTQSVIWSNSGGIVTSVSSRLLNDDDQEQHHPILIKDEDMGDLDGIDDDDLLEAKEEMDMDEMADYGDGDCDPDGEGQVGKGELKCKFCGFVCCSKSSLGIHERRHTGERPFACKYCGRLFNSAQCCKHHERLHTGDKPFQCSYCGKKYAVSTRLKRHERVHTREEPYKCTECNKTFRWFDAFRDHRNTHTGVPLYLCSVCGKTFTSYLKFYYHERGHLMKKERDRDRAAKQKLLSGGADATQTHYLPAWALHVSKGRIPISTTIDIVKSLQKNSAAGILSTLNAASSVYGGAGAKKTSTVTAGAKGNAKKSTSKAKNKGSSGQSQIGIQ